MQEEKMNIKIYVITHKMVDLNLPFNYQKLLVGACKNQCIDNGYVLDDSSDDNISNKNSNYCELTGLYWIWKNDHCDVKGLVHYRRFFTKNRFSSKSKYFYTRKNIEDILKTYDVIVAEKIFIDEQTIKENYLVKHKIGDWNKLKKIIEEDYSEYLTAFEQVECGNWFYPYNMLIAEKKIFDRYAAWVFDILGKLENVVDLSGYDIQQARIYGFLSERLLAVWLIANGLKVYEAPVIQLDSRVRYRARRALERCFQRKITIEKVQVRKDFVL
jgi:hypothetical protein